MDSWCCKICKGWGWVSFYGGGYEVGVVGFFEKLLNLVVGCFILLLGVEDNCIGVLFGYYID